MGSFPFNLAIGAGAAIVAAVFALQALRRPRRAKTSPTMNHHEYLEFDRHVWTLSDLFLKQHPEGFSRAKFDEVLLQLLAFLHMQGEVKLVAGAPLCRAMNADTKKLCGAVLYRLVHSTDVPCLQDLADANAAEFEKFTTIYLTSIIRRDPRFMLLAGESPEGGRWPTELQPFDMKRPA